MRSRLLMIGTAAALAVLVGIPAPSKGAQVPLGYVAARGQTVTPAYEGWYFNSDGTRTVSFGYYNRNREEVLEIPFGPDNFIEPAQFDSVQPTRFEAVRHWGVFGIVVPPDFHGTLRWTLKNGGKTFMIPANLTSDWELDALLGEASGNLPPELAGRESGPWVAGPGGLRLVPVTTTPGTPTALTVWARDDSSTSGSVRASGRVVPVTLTWFKHSGPGDVTFSEVSEQIEVTGGSMTTMATFTEPGGYVVRVRANDASGVSGAGHSQCCWSNAFVKITVN